MLTGKKANLEIQSENGKAVVNLTAEVEVHPQHHVQSRNGPARQRHREKRVAARESAAGAASAPVKVAEEYVVVKKTAKETQAETVKETKDIFAGKVKVAPTKEPYAAKATVTEGETKDY